MNINTFAHIGDTLIALALMIVAMIDVKWAVVLYFAGQVVVELFKALTAYLHSTVDAAKRVQQ